MQKSKLDEIEAKARDTLEETIGNVDLITPPVNLAKILEKHNISLAKASFRDPSVAGAFDKAQRIIYLSKNESYKRQLFTAAHELGHLILGHQKNFDVFYRQQATEFNGSTQNEDEEKEANYFAAALLMPKELVKKIWDQNKDLELLAAHFGVSRTAAYWRLKNLGVI